MKTLLAFIACLALGSCETVVPLPDGNQAKLTTVFHDFDSPDNSPTNPAAVLGVFTERVSKAAPVNDK